MSDGQPKRAFLLDAMSLLFRGYYAFIRNPLRTKKGLDTSAIYGFVNILVELIRRENPDLIIAVFESEAPTFRHKMVRDYKATRPEAPEAIKVAIPYVLQILKAMNIPVVQVEGYEADDVIATLAKKLSKQGYLVYVVTSDKDLAQIVNDKVKLYRPSNRGGYEVWDRQKVKEEWGVEPDLIPDVLALMGDKVDNIPGVPGIGKKTAVQLVSQYGTIEDIYENLDGIPEKWRKKLEGHKEQALLSKKLILLNDEVEIDSIPLSWGPIHKDEIARLFDELEFRRLKERLIGESATPSLFSKLQESSEQSTEKKSDTTSFKSRTLFDPSLFTAKRTIKTENVEYFLVKDASHLQEVINELMEYPVFAIDTETSAINPHEARLLGISLCARKGRAWYVAYPDNSRDREEFNKILEPLLQSDKEKVGQNIKYDLVVLHRHGFPVKGPFFDTMIAHWLIDPEGKHNMDALARHYLNYDPISITALIGRKGSRQKSMAELTPEQIKDYAAEDADITLQLRQPLIYELQTKKLDRLFYEVEMPLLEVLTMMELTGIAIDTKWLLELDDKWGKELFDLQEKIYSVAKTRFNINSPKQLGEILFKHLKLPYPGKPTSTGAYSTSEKILNKLRGKHEIIDLIFEYRELSKLKSTYVAGLLKHVRNGRVHTNFNQAGTVTGRLSSSNPNVQNIPVRTERGREIRRAFIASEGYHILSMDYSQIELRIIASLSEDENLIQAFLDERDIHSETAMKMFNVKPDEITPELRRRAKAINFGIIYGISAHGLAEQLKISRTEANEIIRKYFEAYPKVKQYIEEVIAFAREHGYVETIMGRRRYLPDIWSRNPTVRGHAERNAINTPIQGSAADIIKTAMNRIHKFLKEGGYKTKLLLQVHDELIFDLHKDEEDIVPKLKELMETAVQLRVPLKVDVGIGDSWAEAH
ncbi:MAG: DNA polymerase I [Chlorobi bacterium]|nr:DNA polymerase I [Chlorobiota bacterium]